MEFGMNLFERQDWMYSMLWVWLVGGGVSSKYTQILQSANIGNDSQVLRLVLDLIVFNGKQSVIQTNAQAWKDVDLNAVLATV